MLNERAMTSGDDLSAMADAAAPAPAKNVIFMVPDGFGDAQATAYRYFKGGAADPVWEDGRQAMVRTGSASSAVTDSAAAATAYATGVKTVNGAVAVDVEGTPLISVLDLASDAGKATGIVSTDVVAGATLAAFAASNADRDNRDEIAQEYIDNGDLDVILGGGRESFRLDPDRDGESTRQEAQAAGFEYVATRDELRASDGDRLLGLFNYGPLELPIGGRSGEPSLAEMAEAALGRLSRDEDGFFLVVEEAGTDIWGHANDASAVMRSAQAYENAVRIARDYAEANPGTLVISVADHETGGMSLDVGEGRTPAAFRTYEATYAEMLVAILDSIADLGFDIGGGAIVERFRATVFDLTGGAVSLTEAEIASVLDARSLDDANGAFSAVMNARGGIVYETTSHTSADVPLYAFGTGAERYDGVIDNTTVGAWLAEAMGLALPADQQGGGPNRIGGTAGDDGLVGAGANDAISGGRGDDALIGRAGDDRLSGGDGNDRLSGGDGNDGLSGGKCDDRLRGGFGDDLLQCGGGSDAFVFRESVGSDRIEDFAVGEDVVLLKDGLLAGFDAVLAASRQSGDDVVIRLDDVSDIRIEGLTLEMLQSVAFTYE